MFQPIIEPFIFRFKPDQYAGRFSVPCDHNVFFFSKSQVFRQVVFDARERVLSTLPPYRLDERVSACPVIGTNATGNNSLRWIPVDVLVRMISFCSVFPKGRIMRPPGAS